MMVMATGAIRYEALKRLLKAVAVIYKSSINHVTTINKTNDNISF